MKEPCYDGYEMIGFKIKNGKRVPNCVPIKQSKMSKEEIAEAKIEELKQLFSNQKVELALVDNVVKEYDKIKNDSDSLYKIVRKAAQDVGEVSQKAKTLLKRVIGTDSNVNKLEQAVDDLGIGLPNEAEVSVRQLKVYKNELKQLASQAEKASSVLFAMMG
jgi:uncharacterized protein (DUF3084 family)